MSSMTFNSNVGIPVDEANLISTVLEGILYGFSVLMFMGTIWTFTYKCRIKDINRPIAAVATLMFLLSTVHLVVGIIRIDDGLVKYRDTYPGGPMAFFANSTEGTFTVKDAILTLQTLLGDGVVIYRCYVVWRSVWVIVVPCIMWWGVAAFGICMVYIISQQQTDTATGTWIIMTFIVLTMATNLLGSGLLAYRIWITERNVSTVLITKRKRPILRVLVDPAILYSVATCCSLISFLCSSNGLYVMADLVVQIIPITFYMVFIRIATSKNNQDYTSTIRGGTTVTERRNSQQYHVQPLHTIYKQPDNGILSFLTDNPKIATYPVASLSSSAC
ncbi:uncharacterized protein EDB91DRAFT_1169289 [Suillus paluster]|uniref:uncharacterized protein n=1 Tax=Suillus paluster TaxID=48578 RepID=UPI001B86E5B3|nr:uncharacterized protein EDB91DRAFT_1169289 [Suillus paluster]KAG1725173.1 hypothetical protein EDB91DRAFT_1169289 [Suillus paluster]